MSDDLNDKAKLLTITGEVTRNEYISQIKSTGDAPLAQGYQQTLARQFEELQKYSHEYNSARYSNIIELQKEAGVLKKQLQNSGNTEVNEATLRFLAVSREMAYRKLGLFANTTQVLTILNTLNQKGNVQNEVKTGEGKSLILALEGTLMAARGHKVDIATPSTVLAARDEEKYRNFYESMGLTSGVGALSNYRALERQLATGRVIPSNPYKADILYARAYDLSHAYQLNSFYPKGVLGGRTRDYLLLDESDYSELDDNTQCRISGEIGLTQYQWMYKGIYNYTLSLPGQGRLPITQKEVKGLRNELKAIASLAKQDDRLSLIHQVSKLSDDQLAQWLRSAAEAALRQEDRDYVIKDRKIIIVDKATGEFRPENFQWESGIHQFVEIKHGITLRPETGTVSAESMPHYIKSYQKLISMTGTVGTDLEIDEVNKTFSSTTFKIPPHAPSKRITFPPVIASQDKHEKILEQMKSATEKNRPVLITFPTVKDEKAFAHFLEPQGISFQELNGHQNLQQEKEAIATAGHGGMITLATQKAGRGIDIELDAQTKQTDGLHVIVTFVPQSHRLLQQMFGRSARQGDPGSCMFILDRNEITSFDKNSAANTVNSIYSDIDNLAAIGTLRREFHKNTLNPLYDRFTHAFQDMVKQHYEQSPDQDMPSSTAAAYTAWMLFFRELQQRANEAVKEAETQANRTPGLRTVRQKTERMYEIAEKKLQSVEAAATQKWGKYERSIAKELAIEDPHAFRDRPRTTGNEKKRFFGQKHPNSSPSIGPATAKVLQSRTEQVTQSAQDKNTR